VARGSQVYIVAGKAATGRRNDAHVLHLSHTDRGVLGRWEELRGPGLLPPERSFGAAALAAPHKLVLFGGLSKTNQHLADLHVLDLRTVTDNTIAVTSPTLTHPPTGADAYMCV